MKIEVRKRHDINYPVKIRLLDDWTGDMFTILLNKEEAQKIQKELTEAVEWVYGLEERRYATQPTHHHADRADFDDDELCGEIRDCGDK